MISNMTLMFLSIAVFHIFFHFGCQCDSSPYQKRFKEISGLLFFVSLFCAAFVHFDHPHKTLDAFQRTERSKEAIFFFFLSFFFAIAYALELLLASFFFLLMLFVVGSSVNDTRKH